MFDCNNQQPFTLRPGPRPVPNHLATLRPLDQLELDLSKSESALALEHRGMRCLRACCGNSQNLNPELENPS